MYANTQMDIILDSKSIAFTMVDYSVDLKHSPEGHEWWLGHQSGMLRGGRLPTKGLWSMGGEPWMGIVGLQPLPLPRPRGEWFRCGVLPRPKTMRPFHHGQRPLRDEPRSTFSPHKLIISGIW